MGAFDGELYALGYRFESGSSANNNKKPSQKYVAKMKKAAAVTDMHLARMPCPGSCGSACSNHFCSSHNGEPYDWITSFCLRNRMTLWEKSQWLKAMNLQEE